MTTVASRQIGKPLAHLPVPLEKCGCGRVQLAQIKCKSGVDKVAPAPDGTMFSHALSSESHEQAFSAFVGFITQVAQRRK